MVYLCFIIGNKKLSTSSSTFSILCLLHTLWAPENTDICGICHLIISAKNMTCGLYKCVGHASG